MGLKKRFIALVFSVFLLFAATTEAATQKNQTLSDMLSQFSRINIVQPTIDVSFQEEIMLKNATLYGINDALMDKNSFLFRQFIETGNILYLFSMNAINIPITATTSMNTVSITPVEPLFNGYYILSLVVSDLVGNQATEFEYFRLNLTETEIIIIEPRLGVSNKAVNNLTIRTTRNKVSENTECKIGVDNPAYNFNSLALKPFETPPVMKPEHTVDNVFSMFGLGSSGQFYIVCKDQTLNRVNQKRFDVYVDTVPPAISSFTFNPPKIIEYPEYGDSIFATINISTNEPVICKYSFNEDKNYTGMIPFDNFNTDDFWAYKKDNAQTHALPPEQKASYTFYVQCEDRAGWMSDKRSSTLEVDLSAGLGIEVVFPRIYTTNKTIDLVATTNKRSACQIKGGKIEQFADMTSAIDQKMHSYALGTFNDGTYEYAIYCRSTAGGIIQEQTLNYMFTIDNTKPGNVNLTGKLVTCYNNKFSFTPPLMISAEDKESGIDHYKMQVKKGSNVILNWTELKGNTVPEVDEDEEGKAIAIENNTAYSFDIVAVNGAGLDGSTKIFTIKYDPNDSSCFEKNPPVVSINENKTKGKTLVEFNCTDESGCDDAKFRYGLSNVSEGCVADDLLSGPSLKIEVRAASNVCYLAYDKVGNNATGSKLIDVDFADSCSDLKKDGDETGIDCGGSCSPCAIGSACVKNIDCSSNYCENDLCKEAKCDDEVKNGPLNREESDVDCGGHCSSLGLRCELGKGCNADDDCKGSFCNPDTKKCAESTCTDGYKGHEEADVDCGGVCANITKCANGLGCSMDSDCISGDCLSRTCNEKVELEKEGGFPFDIVLIVLGILMILGGSGYLVYKKETSPALPAAKARIYGAQPAKEGERTAVAAARPDEERLRKIMGEQRKRALEEQKRREEDARKRLERLEVLKRGEREKVFGKFGGKVELKQDQKKQKIAVVKEYAPEEKEGWLDINALKERFVPKKEPQQGIDKKAGELQAPPKPSVFDELSRLKGEETEDVYKKLDSGIGKKKEGGVFEDLEGLKPGSDDVYDELRKYIRPEKRKKGQK